MSPIDIRTYVQQKAWCLCSCITVHLTAYFCLFSNGLTLQWPHSCLLTAWRFIHMGGWASHSCEPLGAAEWTTCTNKDPESTEVSWISSSAEGQGTTNLFDFGWWCPSASSLPREGVVMSDPWYQPGAPSTSLDTPLASKQIVEKENPQRELLSQIWVDKGEEVKT